MSTRLVLNGRTAYGNAAFWNEQRAKQAAARSDRALRKQIEDADSVIHDGVPVKEGSSSTDVHDVRRRSPSLVGVPFTCPVDHATYRIIAALDPAEGWVTAHTVMSWYGVPYETVVAWLKRGLLDGALERGSVTKRFRVLDPAVCKRESKAAAPPAPRAATRKGGRPRKAP